ncbi:segregation and condensation protein A [Methanolobus halotolerans]|uniref:Segregation/condensation protein A n=1 Tax=Methanolobus halotolerans TaxID=2052935 RepID=A0A4E0Q2S0_9EURY|nr:ScpA family protein [Methanolobus halotolerans]TGC07290.1 segregation/condensation protein A [Methanolobus halotolerans]
MNEVIEDADIGQSVEVVPLTEIPLPGTIDPEFMETLRSLGVDESLLEFSDDVLSEPVEILMNLAKNGDINPWDIDIMNVTDMFLERIEQMQMTDLRISGRTLLYASILLRMKSTGIVQDQEDENDLEMLEDELDFYDVEEYPVPKLPIRRRATRPVTLQELILELQKAEKVETRRKDRRVRRKIEERSFVTTDEVLGIAHEEDILGRVKTLGERLTRDLAEKEFVVLSDLMVDNRSENIMTYVSLLFLATEKKVWLSQKELFGELYVYPADNMGIIA